ncbi:MAG TPA: helix-turn-helix transcriptional regulator [Vicinamibacteria bacterium]
MPEPVPPAAPSPEALAFGPLLREWRGRRRLSQLALALDAGVSSRHLSFVETGRAQASRDMVLLLAERLQVPLREQNLMLLAAGFAPVFPLRTLDDPALKEARRAVEIVLEGHEPYPALAVDRHWNLVLANRAVAPFLEGVAPELLAPSLNVLRLSLHPRGLARRIGNLAQWRHHVLTRLRHQIDVSADAVLLALRDELAGYEAPSPTPVSFRDPKGDGLGVVVPLQLVTEGGVLSFFTTTTVFGTPIDIALSELAIEAFFPADAETADRLRRGADPANRAALV